MGWYFITLVDTSVVERIVVKEITVFLVTLITFVHELVWRIVEVYGLFVDYVVLEYLIRINWILIKRRHFGFTSILLLFKLISIILILEVFKLFHIFRPFLFYIFCFLFLRWFYYVAEHEVTTKSLGHFWRIHLPHHLLLILSLLKRQIIFQIRFYFLSYFDIWIIFLFVFCLIFKLNKTFESFVSLWFLIVAQGIVKGHINFKLKY